MAKQGQLSSSSHFFKVILDEVLENGYLELPRSFVNEHGESLSKYAHLKVPTGAESKMELKRRDGRAWLHKGWQDFVDKYSIQWGYFLVFKYEGESRFDVMIFDKSTSEIKYPVSSARTCNKKAGKLTEVKEEEEESLDELPQKVGKSKKLQMAKESGKLISGLQSFSLKNKSMGGDLVNVGVTSARDRVTERAEAFQIPNFQFTITMPQTYISKSYLILPASPTRSYFRVKGSNNDISLKVADGRTWCMKYTVGAPPLYRVCISSGWVNFKQDNHLQKGDICIFELVNNSTSVIFKVTIHPIAAADDDLESNKNGPLVVTDVTSNAMEKFKKSVESFESKNPHFMIRMTSYYVSQRPKVHIPSPHAKRYLKKDKHGKNVITLHGSNGKTWPVHYRHYIKSSIIERVEFHQGWNDFASENRLRVGDRLVFEMINGKPKEYKVNIFRVADHA